MAREALAEAGRVAHAVGHTVPGQSARPDNRPSGLDAAAAHRFLSVLREPCLGSIELRVLRAVFDRRGRVVRADELKSAFGGNTLAGWFDDDLCLVNEARRLTGVSGYVTFNPVRLDLLARSDNRLARARHTTRDADILCLRWLYLDIDPVRPAEISSTDAELAAALLRRDAILGDDSTLAAAAMWGCSGNGAWILVRLPDYPNDARHAALLGRALESLDRRYSDAVVKIDTATANPARLIGLPGTLKAKGSNRPERPWRRVTLDGMGAQAPR